MSRRTWSGTIRRSALAMAMAWLALLAPGVAAATPAPGSFAASCGGGRGVPLPGAGATASVGPTAVLHSGVLLVSTSTPTVPFLVEAIAPDCKLDAAFGTHGVRAIRLPSTRSSEIDTMTTLRSGNVLVVGSIPGEIVGAELTPTGQLVPSFGRHGWLVRALPGWTPGLEWGPSVSDVVQARNGDLMLASDNGEPHAETRGIVIALNSTGHLDGAFAKGGWTQVLGVGDYVDQLIPEPNGSVVIFGDEVFGGCGGPVLEALSASGRPEPEVSANLDRTEQSLRRAGRVGGVAYLDPEGGLGLVGYGWGLHGCFSSGSFGVTEQLAPQGTIVGGTHRTYFDAGQLDVTGGTQAGGRFVAAGIRSPSGTVGDARAFQSSGAPDLAFGQDGAVRLWLGPSLYSSPPVVAGAPLGFVYVLVTLPHGPRLFEVET